MTHAVACHVRSHTGEPGNECADALAEFGWRGLAWSPCILDRLLHCVHRRLTRRPEVQTPDLYSILYWSRVPDRYAVTQPLQAREGRGRRCDEVVRLKVGTANVMTLYPPTFPRSIGTGPSSAIISFTMVSVKNSRLMSFGIISLTTNIFCASSIVLNWCSYSATFSDHAVSLSFSSFASLHLLGVASMGCSAIAGSTTWAHSRQPMLPMPRTRDLAPFE